MLCSTIDLADHGRLPYACLYKPTSPTSLLPLRPNLSQDESKPVRHGRGERPQVTSQVLNMYKKKSLKTQFLANHHVKLSSMKSITVSPCSRRTAPRTSSARPPGPQTVTTMAPIWSCTSLASSSGTLGRPG